MLNFDLNSAAMQFGLMGNDCAQSRVVAGRDHRLSGGSRSGKRLLRAYAKTPAATRRTTIGVAPMPVERSEKWRQPMVMPCCAPSQPDTPAAIWASLIISQALSL